MEKIKQIEENARDLCWQVWNMWNPFNSDLTEEGTKKLNDHLEAFDSWWEGKRKELYKDESEISLADSLKRGLSAAKLWDLHSTAIPEDAYGGSEEIAEMVAGKSIMYEKDFLSAMAQIKAQ